jgi:hypothetical protein
MPQIHVSTHPTSYPLHGGSNMASMPGVNQFSHTQFDGTSTDSATAVNVERVRRMFKVRLQ